MSLAVAIVMTFMTLSFICLLIGGVCESDLFLGIGMAFGVLTIVGAAIAETVEAWMGVLG